MTRHLFILGLALLAGSCVTDPIPLGALNASVGPDDPATTCGNGTLDGGEVCDDGANDNCGDCNADCTGPGGEPVCGDGDVCADTEACDDGFTDDCGTCNADCSGPGTGWTCGDGFVCPQAEVCDDGDRDNCNECNSRCSGPGENSGCVDLTGDTFDPNEVYIWGTFEENQCDQDAIVHWSNPNRYVVGFDCDAAPGTGVIQPIEQRLLYANSRIRETIHAFHCDECPGWTEADSYPTDPRQNDTVVQTPPCPGDATGFLVAPDSRLLYRCGYDDPYYDADTGSVVYSGAVDLGHLTYNGVALSEYAGTIVDIEAESTVSVTGLPRDYEIVAVRAVAPEDFWVAVYNSEDKSLSRWRILASGGAVYEDGYAGDPTNGTGSRDAGALDGDGNLFTEGMDLVHGTDLVIRYRADGSSSAVVYVERGAPVSIYEAGFITGP